MTPQRGAVSALLLWLALFSLASSSTAVPSSVSGVDRPVEPAPGLEARDGPRDLFDQMVQKITNKLLHGSADSLDVKPAGSSGSQQWTWSVHPLPRRSLQSRQLSQAATPLNLAPVSASSSAGADDSGEDSSSSASLVGNSMPVSAATTGTAAQSSGSAAGSASVIGSASPASAASVSTAPPASLSSSSSPSPSSSSASPSGASSATSPSLSSLSRSASSSSIVLPTKAPLKSDDDKENNTDNPPLLSPKNKMFPLVVAGLAAAGILAMMLLISIARAIAHEQLRRDKLKRTYGFDDNAYGGKGDKFTTSGQGMSAARSLRRAMTKKKPLGSFARRQADGSVLIEVGDEVFSVPPHLADTYRERILREKRSKSDLSASTYSDGPFGKIRPQHLTDFDDEAQAKLAYDDALNGEFSANHAPRRSLSQRLTDGLRALTGAVGSNDQDRSNDNNRNNTNNNDHSEKSAYSFDASHQPRGAMRQVDLASQMPVLTHGASDWSITRRGGGGGDEEDQNVRANLVRGPGRKIDPTPAGRVTVPTSFSPPSRPIVSSSTGTAPKGASSSSSRKPVPKLELGLLTEKLQNLEKQSQGSSRLPAESSLSHSRITLRDEPVSGPSSSSSNTSSRSGHGTFGGSGSELSDSSAGSSSTIPGSFPADRKDNKMTTRHDPSRARSIKPLILNMPAGSSHPAVGTYRHRKPTATATAEGAAGAGRSKTTHLSPAAARGHGPPGITIPKRNPTLIASVPLASPTRYTAASSNRPGVTMNPEKPQQAHYSQTSKGTFHPLPVPPPFKP